jgi:eukaryotic-like serine/threonine-protein kinase
VWLQILDHRGIVGTSPIGVLAHPELARALAISGTFSEASEEYQRFFALWRDADEDIPILNEAKSEFSRIATTQNPR